MSFKTEPGSLWSNSHSVILQYTILTPPNVQIENIQVNALNPTHVQVTYTTKGEASEGFDYEAETREDIVSVSSVAVRDTENWAVKINGTEQASREISADLSKCSDEFMAAERQYMDQNNLVENSEVTGQVPSN
jgi:hypothetical protein